MLPLVTMIEDEDITAVVGVGVKIVVLVLEALEEGRGLGVGVFMGVGVGVGEEVVPMEVVAKVEDVVVLLEELEIGAADEYEVDEMTLEDKDDVEVDDPAPVVVRSVFAPVDKALSTKSSHGA